MGKFDGKRLLMLGSSTGADHMVRYARDNGAYVYVADYLAPERSSAKRLADEVVLVSTADVEALCDLVRAKRIDGVIAGVSEFNLLRAMEVAEACGLPFYCTREQWEAVQTKDRFRSLCVQYGVSCPAVYYAGAASGLANLEKVAFPAVLKPVDACSSRGVHVCHDIAELQASLGDAIKNSQVGRVIVEEFCTGTEFTAHFVVAGGTARFACVDNRYPVAVHEGNVTTIPVARIYPSLFTTEFERQVAPSVCRLCEGIGLVDAVMFVQGMYDAERGRFAVFEAGMRSAGEIPSRFMGRVNGADYLDILVDHVLLGCSDYDLSREDPSLKGRCCGVVSFVTGGGVVGSIEGLDKVADACPSVLEIESRYPPGSTAPSGDTLHQIMVRFVMDCASREQMAHDIALINEIADVKDEQGRSMVFKMDPDRVFDVA